MKPRETNEIDRLDAEEFLASFRVARIHLSVPAPITFEAKPRPALGASWESWLARDFASLVAPAFVTAYNANGAPDLDGVLTADARLDAGLDPNVRGQSATAGEELFHAMNGARHLGVPARYRDAVFANQTPGHFAVALATRCSAFHVPPVAALYGLCYLEWFGGRLPVVGPGRQPQFLRNSGSALERCREAALAARAPEFHPTD